MIRKEKDQTVDIQRNMRGGTGEVSFRSLLCGEEEMNDKGRLFKLVTIPTGASIGYHVHEGESETFYVIEGNGVFDDNGTPTPFAAGDVLHTPVGCGHSVTNTGTDPVRMVALILFA